MADLHYNAFISYRHNERDSRIAANLQKELERFRIPGAIRRSSGIQRIERIFRDKEELPITIDLGDNIEHALANSDFLIVICSPELLESRWCMRELEVFLSGHPRSHVLTVLTAGEPDEVVPKVLLSEKREVTLEDGTVVEEIYESEPLSCDYREAARGGAKELRKANREELPRLAACMLGCAYDELIRRQHQYRMRRLAAVSGTAAVLMGIAISYLLWSRNAIHSQYLQTLRSQSVNLAGESLSLLEEDDRISALQLALAALPDEKVPDRPVTPKAMFAITQALSAYSVSEDRVCSRIFRAPDEIDSFAFSGDGKYLLTTDKAGLFSVFDISSGDRQEVWEVSGQDNIPGLLSLEGHKAVVWRSDSIFAMDYLEGEQLWADRLGSLGMNVMLVDREGGPVLFVENRNFFYVLDPESGDILSQYQISDDMYGNSWFDGQFGMDVSPDGKLLACARRYNSDDYGYRMTVSVWNSETGSLAELPVSFGRVDGLCFCGNDGIAVCGRDDPYQYSEMARPADLVEDNPLQIVGARLSGDTLSVLWDSNYHYAQEPAGILLESVPYLAKGDQVLAAFAGNVMILDRDTGSALFERQVAGNIASKLFQSEDAMTLVSTEGRKIVLLYGPGSIYYQSCYIDGLKTAVFLPPAQEFVLRNGKIYCYEQLSNPYFNDLTVSQKYPYTPVRENYVSGGVAASLVMEPAVILTDTETGTVTRVPLEGDIYSWTMLGALPEEEYGGPAFLLEGPVAGTDQRVITLLFADGSMKELCSQGSAGTAADGLFVALGHCVRASGNRYYCTDRNALKSILCVDAGSSAGAGMPEEYTFPDLPEDYLFLRVYRKDLITDGTFYLPSPVFPAHSAKLVFTTAYNRADGTNVPLIADLENGTFLEIEGLESDGLLMAEWNEDDSLLAVTGENAFYILDLSGKIVHTVPRRGKRVDSLKYIDGVLFALFNDHTLVRYDAEVNTLSETTVQYTDDYSGLTEQVLWTLSDPYLYLQIDDDMNIYDMHSWADTPVAVVPHAAGFVPKTNLLCIAEQNVSPLEDQGVFRIGTFPLLTVDQLTEWGRKELNGLEPDDEMKARYGLD